MAERTVKVTLLAQAQGYVRGMDEAARKTRETAGEVEKLAAKRQALQQLGTIALGVGAAAAAGLAIAVAKFAEFDQQMSFVQAATHETAGAMTQLREAALEAGARTVFSANEAANAIEELAKAGVSTADILGGALDGALDLAAAGGLGVADAAGIASTALKTFQLEGRDMSHVADLLAAGAGKAMGDVGQLSQALAQGGQVAKATGLSIEETTAALSAFASQGLLGSDAGTSFKSMLQRLTPQSGEARKMMELLGISAYDASGQFIGLTAFAGNLQNALKDLTPEQRNSAMATIFGSDAVRAATVLYAEGAEGIRDWIAAVDDQGYAAETARIRLDNLKGDLEELGGAMDTALIQSGSAANDALRGLTQTASDLVNGFNALPKPVQDAAVMVGGLTAAAGLLVGGFMILIPKIAETKAAMSALNLTGTSLARGLAKGLGVYAAVTALTGALASYGSIVQLSSDKTADLDRVLRTSSFGDLDQMFVEMDGSARSFADTIQLLGSDNFFLSYAGGAQQLDGAIKALTLGTVDLGAWADENRAKLAHLGEQLGIMARDDLSEATTAFRSMIEVATASGTSTEDAVRQALATMPEYKAALIELAAQYDTNVTEEELLQLAMGNGVTAMQIARDTAKRNETQLALMGSAADTASSQIQGLADQIRGFGSLTLSARDAERAFQAAIDDATATLNENGAVLDITTAAGRANEAALDAIAQAALQSAAATYEQTNSQEAANAKLAEGRTALIDQLAQFGITGEAAEEYADKLGLIPENISTAAALETTEAQNELDRFINTNNGRRINLRVNQAVASGGTILGFAGGGTMPGIGGGIAAGTVYGGGTSKSDSVLVALSRGEEVIQEPYASAHRPLLKAINAGLLGLAGGGTVPDRAFAAGYGSGAAASPIVKNVTLIGEWHEAPGASSDRKQQVLAALRIASSALGLEGVGG